MSHCLVIIDVQPGMFAFRRPLYRGEEVLERIAGLLERGAGRPGADLPRAA
jgi:nicotinamidase-related amidase